MMESTIPKIGFALIRITAEQFLIQEEGFSENGIVRIGSSFKFGSDYNQRTFTCYAEFTFESDNKPFIIVEAGCHFQIADKSWEQMTDKKSNSVKIPKDLLIHFAVLTVGTTRGILHAKTENTGFSNYFLPTINVSALIKKDLVLKFDLKEAKKGKVKKPASE